MLDLESSKLAYSPYLAMAGVEESMPSARPLPRAKTASRRAKRGRRPPPSTIAAAASARRRAVTGPSSRPPTRTTRWNEGLKELAGRAGGWIHRVNLV
eukprot:scaffold36106_cov34-Tisochrysis_lutea.AAC.3